MKKRVVAVMMAAVMAFALTACGKSSDSAESSASTDSIDPDKYVKIGDLESLEVTVDKYTFTDEDVAEQMQDEFEYYVDMADSYDYQEITDRTDVQEGDFCNIDYEGTKDGVAFDGGTAEGYNLEIGSDSFIDGFEDGLIGHEVGEELDLNLTFPDSYTDEDLAGQAVVFHVKINKIQTQNMPEMTDESVAALGMDDYATVADFEAETRQSLQQSCDDQVDSDKSEALWTAVMDACEVSEVPDSLVETYKEEINKNAQSYAEAYGVELEDFITSYMGMDMDEFNSQVEESAKSAAEENLVTRAIAKKADLEVTEDEMNSRAEAEYAEYQYESAEAFLEDVGEFTYQQYLLQEKVEDYLMGIVKFVEGEEVNIQSYYYGDSDEDESEVDEDSEDVIEIDGEDEESDEVLSDEEASDEEETDEEASENEGESDDTASEDGAEDEEAEE